MSGAISQGTEFMKSCFNSRRLRLIRNHQEQGRLVLAGLGRKRSELPRRDFSARMLVGPRSEARVGVGAGTAS